MQKPITIFQLREQSPDDIKNGIEAFLAVSDCKVLTTKEMPSLLTRFTVLSGDRIYQIHRFETFAHCECKHFEFTRKCCKHIAATLPPKCECGRAVKNHKDECTWCRDKKAPYIKQSSNYKPTMVGRIRV